jgi:Fe-S cluster assembly scaffold protein SufB
MASVPLESEFFNSRILIVLEDGAKLNCVHHFHGEAIADSSLVNHVTEAFIGENASLELNFLQEIGTGNLVNTTEVNVERDGRFTTNTVQLSGKSDPQQHERAHCRSECRGTPQWVLHD